MLVAGHQQDAQACYERALQATPNDLSIHRGFIRNLMDMGQVNMAFVHTSGVLADKYVPFDIFIHEVKSCVDLSCNFLCWGKKLKK